MVFTFNLINLGGLSVGASPTVAINRQAGAASDGAAAPSELHIPFQDLNKSADILSLLSWQTAISDFAGRQAEMAALMDWAESEPRTSVKFVVGEGGIGKTRLAAEFGLALREKGWDAGCFRTSWCGARMRLRARACLRCSMSKAQASTWVAKL